MKIFENKVMCRNCGDVIESRHEHELRRCLCGVTAIEGGHRFLGRYGDDYVEIALLVDDEGTIHHLKAPLRAPKYFRVD